MLKDFQLRQMYQLLTENSVEGKRSTSITGVHLGKNKRSVNKRKVCLFVFFESYNFFLIQTISNKWYKKLFNRHMKFMEYYIRLFSCNELRLYLDLKKQNAHANRKNKKKCYVIVVLTK